MNTFRKFRVLSIAVGSLWVCASGVAQDSSGQVPDKSAPAAIQGTVQADVASPQAPAPDAAPLGAAPATITLQDALKLARKNSPMYQSALTDFAVAREDKVQSRAALLPNVNFNTQAIYTQPTPATKSAQGSPRFIAGNGVHEYLSQANIHQVLSLDGYAGFRRAQAAEAVARAKSEIAARGLVLTVVQSYYGFVIAQRKYATAQKLAAEGEHFLGISQKLENGGEVAHADVIKARLQFNQQSRDLQEAQLAMDRSRLDLAVLIFPDFNQNFSAVDDLQSTEPLASLDEVRAAAGLKNPELRAALASVDVAKNEVTAAWSGFLPSVSLDYFYGIDAAHFATRTAGVSNLGYATSATLQFPVWSWGAGVSKLKQAHSRRALAQVELSFAQRQLLANLQTFYDEAQTSRAELESLQQSAELAAESLRLTTLRYQAGEATVLEVADAQNTFALSRNAYDDGQARYRTALANLQTLTGNL
jgi:outer membrane protein TolC